MKVENCVGFFSWVDQTHLTSISRAIATEKVPLDHEESNTLYNIEFVFDSDVRCTIRIHYFAIEEVIGGQIV